MLGATFGSYRIVRMIGAGGMGAVYAAEHTLLGRAAAIKVLLPEYSVNSSVVMRFFNEAKAATAIRHPGIVEIYDFGYTPDGSGYIAMELLEGQSLTGRMRVGALRPAHALTLVRQISGALAAAHAKGIVHRDLKPDNVFIVPDPEVPGGERIKLLDFGIAKLMPAAGGNSTTNTGAVLGTPTYMAPEQCRGVAVDQRVDLYALGCILFEMLTGRPPFTGEGAGDVLAAHIHLPPPAVRATAPWCPESLERLVAHLLVKDPAHRVSSAAALIGEIDRLATEVTAIPGPAATHPEMSTASAQTTLSAATGAGPRIPAPRRAVWIGLGLTVIAIVGVVIAIGRDDEPTPSAGPPTAARLAPVDASVTVEPVTEPVSAPVTPTDAAEPVASTIRVAIDSRPQGAEVVIAAQVVGTTPYRGELPVASRYVITVRRRGHVDRSLTVDGTGPISETVTLLRAPPRADPAAGTSNKSVNPF